MDWRAARALLEWQVELGITEAIGDVPVNRYAEAAAEPARRAVVRPATAAAPPPTPTPASRPAEPDAVAEAERAAAMATDLATLRAALDVYPHCDLRKGARNLVFADGRPGARVMVVGEAPGRDEDIEGRPFVGKAGQLLDRMFAAIGLARTAENPDMALYITNVLPWRPPNNREPTPEESAMMRPFLLRHIRLAAPRIVVLMGNTPCDTLLGRRGILRMRGGWTEIEGLPTLPMCHPAYLLRNPVAKREAWSDLLALRARLEDTAP